MHFVVVGCGAVGGYFGGRLAQNNEKVTFVSRGKQLASLINSGLKIESIEGDILLPNVTALNSETLNESSLSEAADVIFIAVKSYHLSEVAQQIKPLTAPHTRIVPLLNGVSAVENLINNDTPAENIYGGLAKIICEKTNTGVISHTGGKPHITLGDLLSNEDQSRKQVELQRLGAIAKCLKLAGISVGVSTDISLALWRKFILVASWGALGAARKLTLGEIRNQSHIVFLLERIVNEYAEIARKNSVKITDKHIKETLTFLSRLPESSETSMQRDIENSQTSEFDVLVDYPMQLAISLGVSTPVLVQCHQTLMARCKNK